MILRILERFREKQDAAGGLDENRPRKTGGFIFLEGQKYNRGGVLLQTGDQVASGLG